jgi:hypothetical protein
LGPFRHLAGSRLAALNGCFAARHLPRAGGATQPRTLSFVHRDDPWSIDLQTSLNRRYSYGAPVIALDRVRPPSNRGVYRRGHARSAARRAWAISPRTPAAG